MLPQPSDRHHVDVAWGIEPNSQPGRGRPNQLIRKARWANFIGELGHEMLGRLTLGLLLGLGRGSDLLEGGMVQGMESMVEGPGGGSRLVARAPR